METKFLERKKQHSPSIYWGKSTGMKGIENKNNRIKRQRTERESKMYFMI